MKLGSLFDGSGTAPLCAAILGWEPVWASEIEPFPVKVTSTRFPRMKHLGDIKKIKGGEIEPVDVIVGGSPCQDLSVAGKQAGLQSGTRSHLFYEMTRIIKEMRTATNGKYPRYIVWENVPGAFSSNKGRDFHEVIKEFCSCADHPCDVPEPPRGGGRAGADKLVWGNAGLIMGDNFSLAWRVLDAQFWGVPQRRRRIFLAVDLGGGRAREVLFEREGVRGYFAQGRTPWQGIAADAQSGSGAADRESEGDGRGLDAVVYVLASSAVNAEITDGNISPCLMARAGTGGNQLPLVAIEQSIPNHGQDARYKGSLEVSPMLPAQLGAGGNNTPFVVGSVPSTVYCLQGNGIDRADTAGCNGKGWKEDTSYTLNTIDRSAVAYAIDQQGGKGGANYAEGVMPTLCSDSHGTPHAVAYAMQGFGDYKESDVASGLKARDYKDATDLVCGVDCRNMNESPELYPILQAKPGGGYSLNFSGAVREGFIVRRLTPLECSRLQGFPDWWVYGCEAKPVSGWWANNDIGRSVIDPHGEVPGSASAIYKMFGNGMALPCVLYVLSGMEEGENADF